MNEGATNDRIHIEGLEVMARIGVPEEERATPQRLVFNITFWPVQESAAIQDEVERTVDYAAVCGEVKRLGQSRSDRLIETLADAVAKRLLELFPIHTVTVELRKFIVPGVKFVSVSVTRRRMQGAAAREY